MSISSSGENARAAVFDSTPGGPNEPGPDRDLLVGSGNILILQSDEEDEDTRQTVPGYFDRPNDDEDGGTMIFRFPDPVAPMSLDLIDIDSGKDEICRVILTDDAARIRIFTVPPLWTGDRLKDGTSGKRTLDLTTLALQPGFLSTATATETAGFDPGAVVRIEVRLNSGGAIDSLVWCPRGSAGRGRHGSTSQSGAPAVR